MKKIIGRFKYIFLIVCAVVMMFQITVCAEETQETQDTEVSQAESASNQIVKIVTAYKDKAGNTYYAKQGTGFVIGVNVNSGEPKKYIVSDYGVVEGENSAIDAIRRKYGLSNDVDLSICYYAVGDMGVLSELKLMSYSNETRYVVLEPSLPLADKEYAKLGDNSGISRNTRVFIKGYSGARSIVTDLAVNERELKELNSVVKDVTTEQYFNDTITYFTVGEVVDEGMAGAPIYDENGCVIGMFILQNGTVKAMSVDNIRTILDSLDINYMVAEDDAYYDVATDSQREELKELITENKAHISSIKRKKYTKKTWDNYYNAIEQADSVYLKTTSTAKQYDDAITNLKTARKKLKTKSFLWIVINIIISVVGLVLIILLFKKLKKRKKIKQQRDRISNMAM